MLTILKLNVQQFKDVFIFSFIIEALFLVVQKMGSDSRIDMCHAIWMMIMAAFLIYYTVCNMVKFYNGNEDLFMHLSGIKRERILFIKAGIAVHFNDDDLYPIRWTKGSTAVPVRFKICFFSYFLSFSLFAHIVS